MRLTVLLLAALIAVGGCDRQKPAEPQAPGGSQPAAGLDRSHRGEPAPDVTFNDPDGGAIAIDDFGGAPTLVNLWASWCVPCVKELPTLDRLARAQAVDGQLNVVAVSQDMGPHASVRAFLKTHAITELGAYHDPKMELSGALGAAVLPTSILYGSDGREIWRYVGDLDWTGAEAGKLLAEAR